MLWYANQQTDEQGHRGCHPRLPSEFAEQYVGNWENFLRYSNVALHALSIAHLLQMLSNSGLALTDYSSSWESGLSAPSSTGSSALRASRSEALLGLAFFGGLLPLLLPFLFFSGSSGASSSACTVKRFENQAKPILCVCCLVGLLQQQVLQSRLIQRTLVVLHLTEHSAQKPLVEASAVLLQACSYVIGGFGAQTKR